MSTTSWNTHVASCVWTKLTFTVLLFSGPCELHNIEDLEDFFYFIQVLIL